MSPPFQASLRARYEWTLGDYNGVLAGRRHPSGAFVFGRPAIFKPTTKPGFSTYDASLGVREDAWTAQFYMQNLTNTRANLFENGNQFVTAETINRPRTGGLSVSYKF